MSIASNYASQISIAVNGWATFPNVVNRADLASAGTVIFDQSNDDLGDHPEYEAFVRLTITDGQKLIAILNPAWTSVSDGQINTPANQTAIELARVILNTYGVPYVDGWAICQAHVAGGGHLSDYFGDTAHWNSTGYAVIAAAVEALLPVSAIALPLPAYVDADAADYEYTPVIILGTGYDSRTGAWTETGSSVASNAVGATITYSGTFRKFGVYRADGNYPEVTVAIDGGAPITDFALYANGYDIGTRAAHTIVVTVISAVQIDEFWAV